MNRTLGDLVGLNIIGLGTGIVCFVLMMSWGRATRGSWPGRTKRLVFIGFILAAILWSNILYFYFRSH
jgi:hypothetical protein